jgi:cell division protein FtsL
MAKRRVAGRGRRVVAGLLVAFVVVASVVIWRRSHGIEQARALRELERQARQLEAERARLERDIRLASSRSRLVPVAERLGMRMPFDSEIVSLPVAAARTSPPTPQP